uniref:DNA-directed RNA polymerase II subunit, putative n=1 Tax=Arundo donax TaxID=35708 RepID=A0A0A9CWJ1_ARUDO
MNLTMCVSLRVRLFWVLSRIYKVIYGHGDHGSLLFFSIYVLYISFGDQFMPAFIRSLPLLQCSDMHLLNKQPLVLNNKQWTTAASIIRIESKFFKTNITNHTNFSVDINLSS